MDIVRPEKKASIEALEVYVAQNALASVGEAIN
jgi:hypothetical protein